MSDKVHNTLCKMPYVGQMTFSGIRPHAMYYVRQMTFSGIRPRAMYYAVCHMPYVRQMTFCKTELHADSFIHYQSCNSVLRNQCTLLIVYTRQIVYTGFIKSFRGVFKLFKIALNRGDNRFFVHAVNVKCNI